MQNIPLYIMSCDKNHDVLEYCLQSISNNLNTDKFTIYVGTNTENIKLNQILNFHYLKSPVSNWKEETLLQLEHLKKNYNSIKNLLVVLDDFIIRDSVNENKINWLLDECKLHNLQYLKLKAPSMTIRFFIKTIFQKNAYSKVPDIHPYYSSLQIAIWDIDHLIWTVQKANNIWDFEHIRNKDKKHFTVNKSVIKYKHVIEKGKWDYNSKKYLIKLFGKFNQGDREYIKLSTSKYFILTFKKYFIFPIFGYSIMKFKTYVKYRK